jgi:hypothetical protein
MVLEATFAQLIRSLERLREAMEHLQLTVREDCPEELALADSLNDAISDQLGWLTEALDCARVTTVEWERESNPNVVQAQLAKAQRLVNQAMLHQAEHLSGCEQFRLLGDLPQREHARSWRDWARTVEASLATFPRLVYAVLEAERECWQALCDSQRRDSVNVRNVSVGQQFFRDSESNPEGLAGAAGAPSKFWTTEPATDD